MNDPDLERLFWEEADGPSSAQRRRQIDEILGRHPEAPHQLAALERFAAALEAVEEMPPPPELKARVQQALADRSAHRAPASLLGGWRPRSPIGGWRPRLAWASMGLLIGILGYHLGSGGASSVVDPSRLSGALNVRAVERSEPAVLRLDDGAGVLRLTLGNGSLVANLEPAVELVLALTVEPGGGDLRLARIEEMTGSRHEIDLAPGQVRVRANGALTLVVDVPPGPSQTLALTVATMGGETVLQRTLELPSPPAAD